MAEQRLASGRCETGVRGAIAAGHPLAAAAGLRALEAGGSAIDACLAAAAVAWVVMPDMCGLGGDLFLLTREPDGTARAITGAGPAPAAGFPAAGDVRAHLALVPGIAAAIETLRGGLLRLPLEAILAPAIGIAEAGFVASALLAGKIAALPPGGFRDELLAGWGVAAVAPGTLLRTPALAGSLRTLARAGSAFPLLTAALPEWRARGVLVSAADIEGYRAPVEPALKLGLGGWTLFGQPPMSQAVATMGALGRAGADALREPDGPFRDHMLIEAYKRAYGLLEGFGHGGDVAGVCRRLLDPAAQREDRESIGAVASEGAAMVRNYGETTQCAAVDREGRVVSLIHSLYRPFGARVLSPATGLIANDRGASFTTGANAPAPGKRPRHTLVNLVAAAPDGSAFALGTPGAQAQTQTTLQVLARVMRDPDALSLAVQAPRWSFIGGKRIACEADLDPTLLKALADMGHEIGLRPARDWLMGSVSLAAYKGGLCHAVADDRRNALALAL